MIRTLIDSRPPALSWTPPDRLPQAEPRQGWQPSLLDDTLTLTRPRPTGIRSVVLSGSGWPSPASDLPDPAHWSAVIALAIAQVLSRTRPVSQLERWLDEPVLADVRCRLHRRQRSRNRNSVPISVVSVRAQCPTSTAVEAAAHLRVGSSSVALAFRLDAYGDRWLTTALELDPLQFDRVIDQFAAVSESRRGRDTS